MTPHRPLAAGPALDALVDYTLGKRWYVNDRGFYYLLWPVPDSMGLTLTPAPPSDYEYRGSPHYSTEWAAGGPLIARYQVTLIPAMLAPIRISEPIATDTWFARANEPALTSRWHEVYMQDWAQGATPLEAVCRAVLALDSPAPPPVE